MDEYLKQVLEQIRCKKAHEAIREELESHITDQMEDNIAAGMSREEAEKAAVHDMGNPVTTGISLDKIHRPKPAWQMILLMTVIMFAGVLIHWNIGMPKTCVHMIAGFGVMLLVYHLDYTRIAEFARPVAVGMFLIGIFSLVYGEPVGGNIRTFYLFWVSFSMFSFFMLYIPVYGAILYSYYGSGYQGLVKAVMWAVPPLFLALRFPSLTLFLILLVSMASLLVLAVVKNWFAVAKKKVLLSIGAVVVVLPVLLLAVVAREAYQIERIRNFL